jgi:hypothetical protein
MDVGRLLLDAVLDAHLPTPRGDSGKGQAPMTALTPDDLARLRDRWTQQVRCMCGFCDHWAADKGIQVLDAYGAVLAQHDADAATIQTLREERDSARKGLFHRITGWDVDGQQETKAQDDLQIAFDRAEHAEAALATALRERDEARAFAESAARQYNELLATCADNTAVTCAFCGVVYPAGTPRHGDGALAEHIRICEKHPMRELEAALATAKPTRAQCEAALLDWWQRRTPRRGEIGTPTSVFYSVEKAVTALLAAGLIRE